MNEDFGECEFIGSAKSGVRVRGVLKGQGDAGNRFTVKCLGESAFVLALSDKAHSAAKPGFGGVLTPVTGLGDELTVRLGTVGINFGSFDTESIPSFLMPGCGPAVNRPRNTSYRVMMGPS
jgi:hypothetical protein